MGRASGIGEATEVNPKGDLAVGQLQKWGPQEFNSPTFHQLWSKLNVTRPKKHGTFPEL